MERLRVDLVLMLLFARGPSGKVAEPITGITRLTKLLFLLEKETNVRNDFNFVAYKMGPYTSEINPVIEFLTSFPSPASPLVELVDGTVAAGADPEQSKYVSELLSGEDSAQQVARQNNKTFKLTEKGQKLAEIVWGQQTVETHKSLELIKRKYGGIPLKQLLKYVYGEYPDMTENSEIKEWVNGN